MTQLSQEFATDLSLADASLACRDAISGIGWNIKSAEPRRIVPKVGFGLARNPSKLEVLLVQISESKTKVTINGSMMGVGPIAKTQLNGQMNRLRNAIEVAVTKQIRASTPSAGRAVSDPLDQIQRLAELRESGAISAIEFEAKKQELLRQI